MWPTKLVRGTFRRRYKRFFADVELPSGEVVVAHCANPGSMKGCATVGGSAWISAATSPTRKLRFTWELAEHDGARVCVNTARANQAVEAALAAGIVVEAAGYPDHAREVRAGESRLDFRLRRGEQACDSLWIEVKCATMGVGHGVVAFPDSVTTRGTRHVEELRALRSAGARAMLLFCVARTDALRVRPADEIDPVYGAALRRAAAEGVEVVAYRCEITDEGMRLVARIPVDL